MTDELKFEPPGVPKTPPIPPSEERGMQESLPHQFRYRECISNIEAAKQFIWRAVSYSDIDSASEVLLDGIDDMLDYAMTIRKREFRKSIGQDPFEED